MPKTSRLPLLLAFLLAGCVAGERRVQTYRETWPAGSVQAVRLTDPDGSVSIMADPSAEVTLLARVTSRGRDADRQRKNGGFFDSDVASDGTLRIGRRRHRVRIGFPFFSRPGVRIDYELRVPASTKLDLNVVNGRISARGVAGEATFVVVNGPIDVETEGEREIAAKTVNGKVRAVFLRQFAGARLSTVNGGVKAILPAGASFTCSLSQVNGDFEASSAFPLRINSYPGSRHVSGEVNGGKYELKISTVNGDVEVQQLAATAAAAVP